MRGRSSVKPIRALALILLLTFWSVAMTAALKEATPAGGPATQLLATARGAVGGEERLRAVTSLVMTGEAENLNRYHKRAPSAKQQWLARSLELRAMWPDRFLLIGRLRLPDDATFEQRQGFAGKVSLAKSFPAVGHYQIDFAKRMLLLLLRTDTSLSLTLRPRLTRKGDLEFTGPHRFRGLLTLDPVTHMPLRLHVRSQAFDAKGRPTRADSAVTMEVLGRRMVDGLTVPERVRYTDEAGRTLSVESYATIQLNAALTAASFAR